MPIIDCLQSVKNYTLGGWEGECLDLGLEEPRLAPDCAVLCCVVLCAMLCCADRAVPCRAVPCRAVPCRAVLGPARHSTAQVRLCFAVRGAALVFFIEFVDDCFMDN